jgi:PAS domain S-box-containing protein
LLNYSNTTKEELIKEIELLKKQLLEKSENEIKEKIKKELFENQIYTQNIINSSLDIICASDLYGNIIEFNSAAEKAFGYTKEESKKDKISIIYASKKEYLRISKTLKSIGSFIGEVKNCRKNGEIFTSFLTASGLFNEKGENIGTMGVSRDITFLKEKEEQLIESEEKYRNLFENATDLIQSVDLKGNIIYVNKSWKKATGYLDNEIKNIFEIIIDDLNQSKKSFIKQVFELKERENKEITFDIKTKFGKKINVKGNFNIKYKEGKPLSIRAILRNVTLENWESTKQNLYNNISKIVVEKANSEEIYEGIRKELGKVMNTETFIISYSENGNDITFPYYYDNVNSNGRIYKPDRISGNGMNEYFLKKKNAELLKREELDKIIKNGGYSISGKKCKVFIGAPLKIKNKTIGVISVQSYDNENEYSLKSLEILDYISGTIALIVQRKQDQNIIEKQSAKLKAIIENSTHLFWTYHKEKGVTSCNTNFIEYFEKIDNKGKEIKLESNEKIRFSIAEHHSFWDKKYNLAFSGKQQNFIYSRKNRKGVKIVKEIFLNPIYNSDDEIIEISGIGHDISEKTLSEKKLNESLKEKEVLLKEVHHRVKNNLQVISSILNLQSSYIKDKKTLDILRESQNRIKSMSFIHEILYKNTDFSEINFSEYIISLSKNLVHSYGIYDYLIDLEMSVGNISLNLDVSIPCGLIVNELVSNALKYAFVNKNKGVIKIELFENNGNVHLIVQDNGLGLPKEINYKDTDSLGLQLVNTLVEQINGGIELDNSYGAKFTIIFKKEQ